MAQGSEDQALRTMDWEAKPRTIVSEYREFPVPERLANHFLCFWTQRIAGSGEYAHLVLPDCCIDIVFMNDERPMVVGPWTDPFMVKLSAGARITGVRLRPGHSTSILGVPAPELLNRSIPLSLLWGRGRTETFERVWQERRSSQRRLVLSEVLSSSKLAEAAPPDETVVASLYWLSRHPRGQVRQLSRMACMSERQIHRRFSAAVGYGPKMFQSVLRFQRFLRASEEPDRWPALADRANAVGYADQPHMTREVRRFTGCPPTALFNTAKCTLRFSDLL